MFYLDPICNVFPCQPLTLTKMLSIGQRISQRETTGKAHELSWEPHEPIGSIDLSEIHGKPWYPVSCIFISLKTVEFYTRSRQLISKLEPTLVCW